MVTKELSGAWTALVTPMLDDGEVDWAGLARNVEFQIDQGIVGLLPTGTTGESPTLSWGEHNLVIEKVVEHAAGRCPVMAGTGSNSTEEALHNTGHALENGCTYALLVDCYYNGPSSLELRREYHGFIASRLPEMKFVPYVIPGRTGCALGPEDLAILADECPNVVGVKEATGDLDRMAHTRSLCAPDFSIMSGDDDLTLEMMLSTAIAADGVISVMSNVVPGAVAAMVAAAAAGDVKLARRINEEVSPLFGLVSFKVEVQRRVPDGRSFPVVDKFRNPLGVKTLMQGLGMNAGPPRPPLGKLTPEGLAIARAALAQLWETAPQWLEPIESAYDVSVGARLADDRFWRDLAYTD